MAQEPVTAPLKLSLKVGAPDSKASKRMTRSAAVVDDPVPTSDDLDPSALSRRRFGPSTRVILCEVPPEGVVWHHLPRLDPSTSTAEAGPSTGKAHRKPQKVDENFRLLPHGAAFSRSRHAGSNIDTSDEYYHKRHRYPEMLEKRSARFELERLVHERAQLVLEIDSLKSRGWAHKNSAAALGKGEQDRRKKLAQLEERLRRYDVLLPDKPGGGTLRNGRSASNPSSRAGSPFPPGPAVSSSNTASSSKAGGSSSGNIKVRFKFGAADSKKSHLSASTGTGKSKGKEKDDGDASDERQKKRSKPPRLPDSFFSDAETRDQYHAYPALQNKYAFGCSVVPAPSKEFSLFAVPTMASWSEFGLSHRGVDGPLDENDDGSAIFTNVLADVNLDVKPSFAACKTFEDVLREKSGIETDDAVPESAIRVWYEGPLKSKKTSTSTSADVAE